MVVAAVVVLLVVVYAAWWSRPGALGGWGSEVWVPVDVDETANVGLQLGFADDERLHVHEITPVVVANTADATIEVVVCRSRVGDGLGASRGSLEPDCVSVDPVTPDVLSHRGRSVVVRITPRKEGVVRIDGADVRYTRGASHLWQTGTEQAGVGIVIRTERRSPAT